LIAEKGVRFLTVKVEKIVGLEARREKPRKCRKFKQKLSSYISK